MCSFMSFFGNKYHVIILSDFPIFHCKELNVYRFSFASDLNRDVGCSSILVSLRTNTFNKILNQCVGKMLLLDEKYI